MVTAHYDAVIAGGSISGLLACRQISASGANVAIIEEDHEIGTPEHCGGLVSTGAIRDLGLIPDSCAVENRVKRARISSVSNEFEINAEKQQIIVLDRRAFDKQIAFQAQRTGAEINVRCSMRGISKDGNRYIVKTSNGDISCDYFIDARGIASIISRNRSGVLQSAQYEVYAPWIDHDTVEVVFDSEKFPGFFAWIIPTGKGTGKVGVAGRSINASKVLESYMDGKGAKYSVIRKVYAPIWVLGPIESFVTERSLVVGDAAGQTKPTTAGGIYTCGLGGILAGKAVVGAMHDGNEKKLVEYQRNWFSLFKSEFEKMLLARRLLERLDNKAIDSIFSAVSSDKLEEISATVDFDFHSAALSKILSTKNASKIAMAMIGNEIRRLID